MKLLAPSLLGLACAYDSSGVSWFDTSCASHLRIFGRECAYWMRCTTNNKPNATTTREACSTAGLDYTNGKCWAKKFRGSLFGGNQHCLQLAKTHCPSKYGESYTCKKD